MNGWRAAGPGSGIPSSPHELARSAVLAVAAGASSVHLHAKDGDGSDTLDPVAVAAALSAVRAVVDVPVGVTTGLWAAEDESSRHALVESWTVLPDFASVNWHEPGSPLLAEALLDRGVGIEAGLHTPSSVVAWSRWTRRESTLRALLEVVEPTSVEEGLTAARELVATFRTAGSRVPVLLHSEGVACWPVLRLALEHGLQTRVGVEDTLVDPDGRPADNGELVARALSL